MAIYVVCLAAAFTFSWSLMSGAIMIQWSHQRTSIPRFADRPHLHVNLITSHTQQGTMAGIQLCIIDESCVCLHQSCCISKQICSRLNQAVPKLLVIIRLTSPNHYWVNVRSTIIPPWCKWNRCSPQIHHSFFGVRIVDVSPLWYCFVQWC